jgi:prolyl oligopeptidase
MHGLAITDPYRWLEDQNSPRTRKWLDGQSAYLRAYFEGFPWRDRIRNRVEELLAVETISDPWKVGNRYFFLKRGVRQQQAAIVMRDEDAGEEIVLVDPAFRCEGGLTAVSIVNISRDGRLLAYAVKHSGSDRQSVEFFDVDSRYVLPDRLPEGFRSGLVFSLDRKGFYYSHQNIDSSRAGYRAVRWHEFGTELIRDHEIFVAGDNANLRVGVFASAGHQFLAYLVIHLTNPWEFYLYLENIATKRPVRRILAHFAHSFVPFFVGEQLFALTDWKSPNFRIVAIDLDHPEPEHWSDLVPESQHRINDATVVSDWICVGYVQDLASRIEVFDLSGWRATIPCPPNGTARLFHGLPESDTLFYRFSSFDQPQTIFSYRPHSRKQEIWTQGQANPHLSPMKVSRLHYRSKDGTEVPISLVSKNNRLPSAPSATFLTAYGGFGASVTPQFHAYSAFLIEQGFLFAVANIRGGGELGEQWHCAGKRGLRQNAFDDFVAAAEWLVREGHAIPDRIAIAGGSNGGLLVGAALTQRPDLFRAVVCLGPMLDMLRYHLFDCASSLMDEYGTASIEDDFLYLRAYSPYHNVSAGTPYPAVLFVSGDADTRCNPMHARKMTARLQAATSSSRPILLDYKPFWGHAPVQPLNGRIEALTDRLAFVCHELGINV